MASLVERYGGKIRGVLSCFDRVVITGTLPEVCHAQAMERHLRVREIRLFDYPRWAEPLGEEVRVKKILAERGGPPGAGAHLLGHEPCLIREIHDHPPELKRRILADRDLYVFR